MANIYVRSTDGSNADNGSTWALAKATLAGAAAITVAGDTVWVSQDHAESTAGVVVNWGGTKASPVRIICANDASEPPTTVATTGAIDATGGVQLSEHLQSTDYIYMYGLTLRAGVSSALSTTMILNQGSSTQVYERCVFKMATTSNVGIIVINSAGGFSDVICKNCDFQVNHISHYIDIREAAVTISGGALLLGTSPTHVFRFEVSASADIEGFDLSNANATVDVFDTIETGQLMMRNCLLPASWSGNLASNLPTGGGYAELNNSTGSTYLSQRITSFGNIFGETTLVRSGGASDDVRSISWKLVSNADVQWHHMYLSTNQLARWNTTTGTPITVTVEILHDSVTNMTNQQIWLEVQYLGTSGSPGSSFINDSSGDYLSSASDQAASSAAWTTTGMSNPNTQKLDVTFTPQEPGFIIAVVKLAQASKTVYVCPKLEITGISSSLAEAQSIDGVYVNGVTSIIPYQRQMSSGAFFNEMLLVEEATGQRTIIAMCQSSLI